MQRIGIIGFGFSGLMVTANLLRETSQPLTLYIIDEHADGLGIAYGTANPDHLLNVRAGNMSAFEDNKNHLIRWLESDAGKYAAAARSMRTDYAATDFIPRALYGDYLQSIWQEAQAIAAQKNCSIKLVPSRAVAIRNEDTPAILTARGDAIAVDRIVLAVGHETRSMLPHIKSPHIIQHPWHEKALEAAATWKSPVMILGTGLTAIDMVLSLRRTGYVGEIILTSRRGVLPQQHAMPTHAPVEVKEITAQKTLLKMLQHLRKTIERAGEWRDIIDALRPHTQALWQRLTPHDQKRFHARLSTIWSVHRHRMAPEIAARIQAEITAATVRVIACKHMNVALDEAQQLQVTFHDDEAPQQVSHIINCTGLGLSIGRSDNALLKHLLAHSMIEEHGSYIGITADKQYRAWGALYPKLFVLGSLLTGQLLESTAVPELRAQAAIIAREILA